MKLFAWDRGLKWESERRRLLRLIKKEEERGGVRSIRRVAYLAILVIQISNGTRISEAAEAAIKFAQTGKREVEVRVRKRRDNMLRKVIIPKEIVRYRPQIRAVVAEVGAEPHRLAERVRTWASRRLGNTHAFRYAFIGYLARRGISAQLIAKITGHRKLDYVLHYTQKVRAEEVLKEVVNGD